MVDDDARQNITDYDVRQQARSPLVDPASSATSAADVILDAEGFDGDQSQSAPATNTPPRELVEKWEPARSNGRTTVNQQHRQGGSPMSLWDHTSYPSTPTELSPTTTPGCLSYAQPNAMRIPGCFENPRPRSGGSFSLAAHGVPEISPEHIPLPSDAWMAARTTEYSEPPSKSLRSRLSHYFGFQRKPRHTRPLGLTRREPQPPVQGHSLQP